MMVLRVEKMGKLTKPHRLFGDFLQFPRWGVELKDGNDSSLCSAGAAIDGLPN
jgi:hypothetical protein